MGWGIGGENIWDSLEPTQVTPESRLRKRRGRGERKEEKERNWGSSLFPVESSLQITTPLKQSTQLSPLHWPPGKTQLQHLKRINSYFPPVLTHNSSLPRCLKPNSSNKRQMWKQVSFCPHHLLSLFLHNVVLITLISKGRRFYWGYNLSVALFFWTKVSLLFRALQKATSTMARIRFWGSGWLAEMEDCAGLSRAVQRPHRLIAPVLVGFTHSQEWRMLLHSVSI